MSTIRDFSENTEQIELKPDPPLNDFETPDPALRAALRMIALNMSSYGRAFQTDGETVDKMVEDIGGSPFVGLLYPSPNEDEAREEKARHVAALRFGIDHGYFATKQSDYLNGKHFKLVRTDKFREALRAEEVRRENKG